MFCGYVFLACVASQVLHNGVSLGLVEITDTHSEVGQVDFSPSFENYISFRKTYTQKNGLNKIHHAPIFRVWLKVVFAFEHLFHCLPFLCHLHLPFTYFLVSLPPAARVPPAPCLQQWHSVYAISGCQTSTLWNHFVWPRTVSSACLEKSLRREKTRQSRETWRDTNALRQESNQ